MQNIEHSSSCGLKKEIYILIYICEQFIVIHPRKSRKVARKIYKWNESEYNLHSIICKDQQR